MTIQEICESLRIHYGHHELWLDWQAWSARKHRRNMEEQPFVTSCSGRHLAAYDGKGEKWSFLLDREQLHFDEKSDYFRPARNKDTYLSDSRIAELKKKYRF
ncbi:hypothetical protein ACV6R0_004454 [Citrobacter freundii]